MDKFGIKGSLYDILGYIMPGAFVLLGLFAMYENKNGTNLILWIKNHMDVHVGFAVSCGILLCSYIVGHILTSIGSFLFENRHVKRLFSKTRLRNLCKIDEKREGETYKAQFHELFGNDAIFSFRNVVAYSQEKTKAVYDTAFVFLSIYGMSRNISVALLVLLAAHCVIIGDTWNVSLYATFFISLFAMVHNYFRFREYYIAQIYASLTAV